MNEIEKYKAASEAFRHASIVAQMVGKRYGGGGGGTGRVHRVTISGLEVYYQEYDGARNYHPADKPFLEALSAAALEMAPELIQKALTMMDQKKAEAGRSVRSLLEEVSKL